MTGAGPEVKARQSRDARLGSREPDALLAYCK
jgi:hypothetical protein